MARVDFASKLKSSITPMAVAVEPATAPVTSDDEPATTLAPPEAIAESPSADAAADKAPERPTAAQRPEAPAPTGRAAPGTRRAPGSRAPKEAPRDEETVNAPFAIELPVSLDELLTEHRRRTRKSHRAVLLDAIEETYDELQELIDAELGRDRAAERRNLFGRSSRTAAPVPADDGEARVTHTFRVTASNRDLITKIADEFEAPSRNFLVVTAYRRYLKAMK